MVMVGESSMEIDQCFQMMKMEGGVSIKEWKDITVEILMRILSLVDDRNVIAASGVYSCWREAISLGLPRLRLSWCNNNMNSLVLSIAPKFVKLQNLILRQEKPQLEDTGVCNNNNMNSLVLSLAPKFVKLQTLMLKVLNPCGRVNAVSDYTLEAIGNNCNQMQSLNLGWCEKISDDGIMSLAYGCPDLRTLDLCGCVLITDESVVALADWCVHLRSLGLYYCRNITDRAMYSLAQSGLKNKPGQWQSSEAEKSQQCTCAHTFSSCSSGLRYVSSSSHVFRLS